MAAQAVVAVMQLALVERLADQILLPVEQQQLQVLIAEQVAVAVLRR
jgi:hypothetical protein